MQSQTASPDHDKYKKQIEKLTKERDRAISDNERLEKEAVANKYTVQSLKDKISDLEKSKNEIEMKALKAMKTIKLL